MAGLASTALASADAFAQAPDCQWYATTALKQQQDNDRRKCGFKGPEWSSDLKAHLAWCASVPPETWRATAQKRNQDLAKCFVGRP